MSLSLGQLAIGQKDGDYLVLENKWARVIITRDSPTEYVVTGDMPVWRKDALTFRTVGAAITEAMKGLALYSAGRAS